MFDDLFAWFGCVFGVLWQSFVDFTHDITILSLEALIDAVIYLLNLFDLSSVTDYTLGGLISMLPNDLLYFLSFLQLPGCLSLIASAYIFRLVRKVITLFQY